MTTEHGERVQTVAQLAQRSRILHQAVENSSTPTRTLKTDEERRIEKEQHEASVRLSRKNAAIDQFCRDVGRSVAESFMLSKWRAETDRKKCVLDGIKEWTAKAKAGERATNLVLYGTCGTGKDHLAFGAVASILAAYEGEKQPTARWIDCMEFYQELRDAIKNDQGEKDVMSKATSPNYVILSDPLPPVGALTEYQASVLRRIIDSRTRNGLATVVTVNVEDDKEGYTSFGVSTWDRIKQDAWLVHMRWKSNRQPSRTI